MIPRFNTWLLTARIPAFSAHAPRPAKLAMLPLQVGLATLLMVGPALAETGLMF
ncbi:MAG: hypothetical protein QM805_21130 [Pseudomonas sp.]